MPKIVTEDLIKRYSDEIKVVDVVQNLQSMTWEFCLSTELWEKGHIDLIISNLKDMKKIKYFGEKDGELSADINKLPNDKGGVYIYSIESNVLPALGSYIMYVGRARKTEEFSLQARAKSHFTKYKRHEENERLERVFDGWKQYIYLSYLPIEGNEKIDLIEEQLILALTPPCNRKYPSPKIRKKLSAFQYS